MTGEHGDTPYEGWDPVADHYLTAEPPADGPAPAAVSGVRKPHPDLAALIAKELEIRRGSVETWGAHIAERVAEWLTSPETIERVVDGIRDDLRETPLLREAARSSAMRIVGNRFATAVWVPSVEETR